MKPIKIIGLCLLLLICTSKVFSQEILEIDIAQAEKQFMEHNLQVLAERCHIAIADAAIAQAKVLNNPTIGIGDINFWHPHAANDVEAIPATFANGITFSVELEQMIRTAGKRKKLMEMEKVSKEIAVQEFEAFLLSLITELRTSLYETIYLQSYVDVLNKQLASINHLQEVYKKNLSSGNIAKSELIRLQSSFIELESEANEAQKELNRQYKDLKVLLNVNPNTELLVTSENVIPKNPEEVTINELYELVKSSRPEFLLTDLSVKFNEKILLYEKAQRSPDIALRVSYDRYGGVWKSFFCVGISLNLPFFDQNQGNIKIAKLGMEQSRYDAQHQQNTILHEIRERYKNYEMSYKFYQKLMDNDFSEDVENMLEVYARNLLNKNINMLEYVDFIGAYKTAMQVLLAARKNLDTHFAALQFSVNNKF